MKHQDIYNRLRKIEGQIRGIQDMLSKDRSDRDLLIQLEAVKSSVSSSIAVLLARLFEIQENGELKLSQEQAEVILRMIKK